MNQVTTQDQTSTAMDQALSRIDREARRNELANIGFQPGQMFQPRDARDLMDMASMISGAGAMIKPMFRGNPAACLGLISICAPHGLNPIQVSWKCYRTKDDDSAPLAFEAQVVVAMINTSGAIKGSLDYEFKGEGPDRQCRAFGTLKGEDKIKEVWSPKIKDIVVKNSPLWKSDPDQQLCYYTARAFVRRHKPEMLLGVYSVDEMGGPAIGPDKARDVTPSAPRRGGHAYVAADDEDVIDGTTGDGAQDDGGVIENEPGPADALTDEEREAAQDRAMAAHRAEQGQASLLP